MKQYIQTVRRSDRDEKRAKDAQTGASFFVLPLAGCFFSADPEPDPEPDPAAAAEAEEEDRPPKPSPLPLRALQSETRHNNRVSRCARGEGSTHEPSKQALPGTAAPAAAARVRGRIVVLHGKRISRIMQRHQVSVAEIQIAHCAGLCVAW